MKKVLLNHQRTTRNKMREEFPRDVIVDAPGLADINEQNLDRSAVPAEGCDVAVVHVQHVTPGPGILVVDVANAGTSVCKPFASK